MYICIYNDNDKTVVCICNDNTVVYKTDVKNTVHRFWKKKNSTILLLIQRQSSSSSFPPL